MTRCHPREVDADGCVAVSRKMATAPEEPPIGARRRVRKKRPARRLTSDGVAVAPWLGVPCKRLWESAVLARRAEACPDATGVLSFGLAVWPGWINDFRTGVYPETTMSRHCSSAYKFKFQMPGGLLVV